MIVQAPVAVSQHAPCAGGTGQVDGLHGTPEPNQVKAHPTWVVIVQAPVKKSQHAPVAGGIGQLLGLQFQSKCQMLGGKH